MSISASRSFPSFYGEKVALRILDMSTATLTSTA